MDENKPIMIDGVDVSGCTYSQIGIDRKCYCEQDLYDDGTPVFTCDECPNCCFKQLARKTQECEELKDKIKYMEEYIKTVENARDELERENKFSNEQAEQKLKKIKDRCNETLELMNKDSGTNAYAGGRCIEAENILKIIDEVE